MKKLKLKEYIIFTVIILGGIVIDQISKIIVVNNMTLGQPIPFIDGLLSFTYITNDGAAWGMFDDARWVFMSVSTVAILGMLFYLYAGFSQNKVYSSALLLLISGGIGNMIDRTFLGYVVDFIDIRPLFKFPIFNIADCLVCIGAGILILALVLDIIAEARRNKENGKKDTDKTDKKEKATGSKTVSTENGSSAETLADGNAEAIANAKDENAENTANAKDGNAENTADAKDGNAENTADAKDETAEAVTDTKGENVADIGEAQ